MVLMAPSPTALQKLINCCEEFANSCEIVFNALKSKLMCIKPKLHKDTIIPQINLNGVPLVIVKTIKYLGAIITDDLKDNKDILRELRSLYIRGNILVKTFKHCSNVVKTLLFKTYCTSFYCSHLWKLYDNTVITRLKTSFNRVFRMLINLERRASVSGAMVQANTDGFSCILRKQLFSFKNRLANVENNIVKFLHEGIYFYSSKMFKRWFKDLYAFTQ